MYIAESSPFVSKYLLTDLNVRVRDAAHVHGGELHGLDDGDGEGLRVEVVLQLVLQLAKVAVGIPINLRRRD